MNEQQLEARRKYYRERYARQKKEGTLPKDRYTPEERSAYNKKYREDNPDYFLKKENEDEQSTIQHDNNSIRDDIQS